MLFSQTYYKAATAGIAVNSFAKFKNELYNLIVFGENFRPPLVREQQEPDVNNLVELPSNKLTKVTEVSFLQTMMNH